MSDDGTRIVLIIERLDKKGVVPYALVYRVQDVGKHLLCGIDEDLIQMLLLTHSIQQGGQSLDSGSLALDLKGIVEGKKVFKVAECDSWRELVRRALDRGAGREIPLQPQFPSPFIIREVGCVTARAYRG